MEISKYLKKKILIVAHDSGSANQIYYLLKKLKINNYNFFLLGPAQKIFKKHSNNYHHLTQAINSSDIILTGTSWQNKLEVKAICYAKKIKSH